MTIHREIFEAINMAEKIKLWSANNWIGTEWESYHIISPKHKGAMGEAYVEGYMNRKGSHVTSPINTGHDRIIDGYKSEIKFSLASSNSEKKDGKLIDIDSFTFNHIAVNKDWDRFIFFGINPNKNNPRIRNKSANKPEIRAYFMTKDDFKKHMSINGRHCGVFKPQQGGKNSNNDDYFVSGDIGKLISLPFVKPISEW